MRKTLLTTTFLFATFSALLLTGAASADTATTETVPSKTAATDTAFDQILEHYEAVRQALSADRMAGVADAGREIGQILDHLESDWSAERAGVVADKADEARAVLPALQTAADQLAEADDLDAARDAFYALSKPLVRFRKAAAGERPVVAYCPMVKRSWLQPEGEIGNPYHGPEMHRCGEVVDG